MLILLHLFCNMNKEIMIFGDIAVAKHNIHYPKNPIIKNQHNMKNI